MNNSTHDSLISKWLPWFIWSIGALFYGYEFFLQVSPGVMVPDLMRSFSATAEQLGTLSAIYFYAYACMQIPVGVLMDRFGPRRLLFFAAITCALGCFIFASSDTLAIAKIGRLLIGLGSSFAVVGTLTIAANWFPLNRFALATGIMVTIGMLGATCGEEPLAMLVEKVGWRETLFILAGAGIVITILIGLIMRDHPKQKISNINSASKPHSFTGLKRVLTSRTNWMVALYGGLMFAPTSAFAALWGVPYLMRLYDMPRPHAAGLISLVFIGWAIGSPLFGWLSDRIGRRKPIMYLGSLGALISFLMIVYDPYVVSQNMIGFVLLAFGLFSSGFLPAFTIIREINPPEARSTALGFMNTINMIGGALAQPLIGWFLDLHWAGDMDNGARIYSLHSFHVALMVLPILIGAAFLLMPFVVETYCREKDI